MICTLVMIYNYAYVHMHNKYVIRSCNIAQNLQDYPLYNALLAEYPSICHSFFIGIRCKGVEGGSDGMQQSTTMKQASTCQLLAVMLRQLITSWSYHIDWYWIADNYFRYCVYICIVCTYLVVFSKSHHVYPWIWGLVHTHIHIC